jgi:hypothetical protein
MTTSIFHPNFDYECRICGASPCVIVDDHNQGETELCGSHFFNDPSMIEWELWNEPKESTE